MSHAGATRRYPVLLAPDPDEGRYTVTVPALQHGLRGEARIVLSEVADECARRSSAPGR